MFNKTARAAIGSVFLVLAALVLLMPYPLEAANRDIISAKFERMFTAEPVAISGTATTASFGEFINGETQSIAWRGVGTSPNFKVELLVTLDGTNYVVPETGGVVSAATTDQNWHVAPLFPPLCRGVKVRFTELGGANTLAADVILGCQ